MKGLWWKITGSLLLLTSVNLGFLINAPNTLGMLDETIRNLFYHVPMWFTMMTVLMVAMVYNILYLNKGKIEHFYRAHALIKVGVLFGVLGIITGSIWARATWGHWWIKDAKLNGAAAGMLIYGAYLILNNSMEDIYIKAKTLSIYNIFVYPIFISLILVMPKLLEFSAHPGAGDTQGFTVYDLNKNLRLIFYPAVIGWILIGLWIGQLTYRYNILKDEKDSSN